jgi:sugar (pentulose or hexulose) kinase
MPYSIGIDFGTSGVRVAVIDPQGYLQFQESDSFPPSVSDWASSWRTALFDLLAAIPLEYRQEAGAIAIDGTSSTVVLCDQIGQPLGDVLLYNDGRGQEVLPLLQDRLRSYPDAPPKDIVLSATSSLIKLLWLSRQPYFAQARYLLHQADWLGFLLHGHLGITDYHNALKLGYDVQNLTYPAWMTEVLASLGQPIEPTLLPKVVPPGQAIASLQPNIAAQFSLPAGCQVCAGTTDSIAAFLASRANQPGVGVTSLGSTLVLKLLSKTPVSSRAHGIYSHRLGRLWLVGGASNTGGAVLKYFFTPTELATLSAQIDPQQPSPFNYYPLLQAGERFPINDPHFLPQIEPRPENPVAFLQGLLEGIARIEAKGYQLLEALGASRLQQVLTAGGGATNQTWSAIRQRWLGVPVAQAEYTEAAYGTAWLAGKIKPPE